MTTVEKMRSSSVCDQLRGIIECLNKKSVSSEEAAELNRLKSNQFILGGRRMSSYAGSVLDILGIEQYNGDDIDTKELIRDFRRAIKVQEYV